MTRTETDDYYQYQLSVTNHPDAYAPWFPPCRPCGHCPACGRGYDYPAYPPYWPWRQPYRILVTGGAGLASA